MAVVNGLAAATIISQLPWARWALPATTLGELTVKMVAEQYRTLTHPYVRNNLNEMRDIVLAGLARCGTGPVEIAPADLRDGTKLEW
ncbi:hypothetical protein [Hymenobacter daeguensis]